MTPSIEIKIIHLKGWTQIFQSPNISSKSSKILNLKLFQEGLENNIHDFSLLFFIENAFILKQKDTFYYIWKNYLLKVDTQYTLYKFNKS